MRFFAARVNFKPRPWLEFGLTRTAQWCGGDRPCDWDTFTDMLFGRDNQVEGGGDPSDQPGNQMAGYDMRLRSPWKALPLAFYTQWIGEDEAGGLPSKFIGLFGLEIWGSSALGGWRLRAEYADTACNFTREAPEFDCAYRNAIYPQGYAYRGRIIGHSMDNDSRMYSLAGLLTRANGDVLSLTLRRVELNRDGGAHAISDVPLDLDNVELRYSRVFGVGKVSVGVGYDDPASPAGFGLRRAWFRDLATRILMRRGWLVLAAALLLARRAAGARAGSDRRAARTAAQHESRRSRGADGAARASAARSLDDESEPSTTAPIASATRDRIGARASATTPMRAAGAVDKTLKPEDSVLIDIDFKKDKPRAHRKPGRGAAADHDSRRARAGARARKSAKSCSSASISCARAIPTSSIPPVRCCCRVSRRSCWPGSTRSRRRTGLSAVERFPQARRQGHQTAGAQDRASRVSSLSATTCSRTAPSTFAPVTDVPVPSDYIVGPGDQLNVQLFGSQNRNLRLAVGRDGRISFPELGPDQRRRPDVRAVSPPISKRASRAR